MRYSVLVSETFKRQFHKLDKKLRARIKKGLKELEEEPVKSRSGADIKRIKGTKPLKYRLRVGDYRIVYRIEGNIVKVIEVFPRGRGYRE